MEMPKHNKIYETIKNIIFTHLSGVLSGDGRGDGMHRRTGQHLLYVVKHPLGRQSDLVAVHVQSGAHAELGQLRSGDSRPLQQIRNVDEV